MSYHTLDGWNTTMCTAVVSLNSETIVVMNLPSTHGITIALCMYSTTDSWIQVLQCGDCSFCLHICIIDMPTKLGLGLRTIILYLVVYNTYNEILYLLLSKCLLCSLCSYVPLGQRHSYMLDIIIYLHNVCIIF